MPLVELGAMIFAAKEFFVRDQEELSDYEESLERGCSLSILGNFHDQVGQTLCWDGLVRDDTGLRRGLDQMTLKTCFLYIQGLNTLGFSVG